MAPRRTAKIDPDIAKLAATLDRAWDEAPRGGNPVAVVVLGFAFLAAFTLVALLAGLSAVAALLLGWVASLSCVVLAVLFGAWREHRAAKVTWPRTRDEHVAVWDADLTAERHYAARVTEWEGDAIIDAVPVRGTARGGRA